MKKTLRHLAFLTVFFSSVTALPAEPRPGFGELFYQGEVVRTVVPPAAMKKPGTDDFYAVMDGAAGQRAVIAVAPGDQGYRGGKWAFHSVVWNDGVEPYLLTSEEAVLAAELLDEVTVTRIAEMDFKCPVQP